MTQSMNQFSQAPVQGMLDLRFNGQTISCQGGSGASGLVAGQAVKMEDSADGIPKVVAASADTDDVFGFINIDQKSSSFDEGDKMEVSALRGNVMYMTASAAIARNAKVMIVVSGNKVATATSGKTIVGRALDKAAADGDLIRVAIDLPGSAA